MFKCACFCVLVRANIYAVLRLLLLHVLLWYKHDSMPASYALIYRSAAVLCIMHADMAKRASCNMWIHPRGPVLNACWALFANVPSTAEIFCSI